MRHKWEKQEAWGHRSGGGTPSGVVSTAECLRCGLVRWRDSDVSSANGGSHPERGYTSPSGEQYAGSAMPSCRDVRFGDK